MRYLQKNLRRKAQRGVVLFIALIALMVMALAAVVLVRSVDTSTIIAGNLAYKQAATSAADAGASGAVPWLLATRITQSGLNSNPYLDTANAFNNDNPSVGYYSSIATPSDLTADATWAVTASATGAGANFDANGYDASTGNTVRYIIQRMCRTPNQLLSVAECLFSDAPALTNPKGSKRGLLEHEAGMITGSGSGGGASSNGLLYRITARVTGPKNSVSYIQTFVY